MSGCETIYTECQNLKLQLNNCAAILESGKNVDNNLIDQTETIKNTLQGRIECLKVNINSEPISSKKVWEKRYKALNSDFISLKTTINRKLQQIESQLKSKRDRRELLDGGSSNPSDVVLAINDSASQSLGMSEQYVNQADEAYQQLLKDKEKIKATRTKLLNILNSLGVSQSILRYVNKTDFIDKIIVYCGMIFIIVLIIVVYYFTKRK